MTMILEDVICLISTNNRSLNTLQTVLTAVINQTALPKEVRVVEDSGQLHWLGYPIFQSIEKFFQRAGVIFSVVAGESRYKNTRDLIFADDGYKYIWRLEDEVVPTNHTLESFYSKIKEGFSMVGCTVESKNLLGVMSAKSSKEIKDLFAKPKYTSFQDSVILGFDTEVEYLEKCFLLDKTVARVYWDKYSFLSLLSTVDDILFSYEIRLAGFKIGCFGRGVCSAFEMQIGEGGKYNIQDRESKTWSDTQAIRLYFEKNLGVKFTPVFRAVLTCGIGDHVVFNSILPRVFEKYGDKVLVKIYAVFPETLKSSIEKYPENIMLLNLEEKILEFGNDTSVFDVYLFMNRNQFTGSLRDAFLKLYQLD